ncbi:MAG: PAS domain S-box protein, partial [Chloroflexota bacterium]
RAFHISPDSININRLRDGLYIEINEGFTRLTGYTTEEVIGKTSLELNIWVNPQDRALLVQGLREHGEVSNLEAPFRIKNGETKICLVSARIIEVNGEACILSIIRDITERKNTEKTLKNLNRELRAIRTCGQTLVRATDEQILLNDICRIVCEEAGYYMAWVGFAENNEAKTVRPVAWAGKEAGYLANVNITWEDTERGRGPTGRAIRSGKTIYIQDFENDPQFALWRESALQRGYRSSISLPIKDEDGKTFGAFMIYSSQPNAFTGDEIRLLEEMVDDLSFGIISLRARSKRKRAEEALRESETKFRLIFESSGIGISLASLAGDFIKGNPAILNILGYADEEYSHMSIRDISYPEDEEKDLSLYHELLDGKRNSYTIEKRNLHKDDHYIWGQLTCSVVRAEDGSPQFTIGMFEDISERKHAETALKDNKQRLSLALDSAKAGAWEWDLQTNENIWSDELWKVYGLEPDSCQPTYETWRQIMHPEDRAKVEKAAQTAVQSGSEINIEWRIIDRDGTIRWVMSKGQPIREEKGKVIRYIGIVLDISERKQAEKALSESEAYVRSKLNAILMPEENIGLLDLTDIIDVQAVQDMMNDFYKLTKIGIAIVDLTGKVLVATGWQDICTKFHRVHPETLQNCIESDTILSKGIEPGAFKIYKCKNNILDMATPIIVGGLHVGNLFLGQFLFEEDTPDYETFHLQAHQYGFDEKEYLAALDRVPRWSHETVNTVMTFYTLFANQISALGYSNIKLARSLTERKRADEEKEKLQQQLLQAQKMETVGRLAGGVAHDFNNLLGVIMGHAELVLANLTPHQAVYHDLHEILKAAERSAALTHQLLAFARKQTVSPQVLNLTDTVASMLKMLQRLIGENIDLTWHPAPDLWHIKMDPSQIDQILANLLVNARDAIPETGTISIE